ncbi:hypothetical protein [Candidatus Nitrososphaera gargensis]|uniref:hypothetical protein n=1 Tax=Candidatus Nitrososphaera gargensis TaxID=497727 RepID=UPI00164EFC70|nr:hypothetical protein [Candidatus Nitrososphaera gargensis]
MPRVPSGYIIPFKGADIVRRRCQGKLSRDNLHLYPAVPVVLPACNVFACNELDRAP